MSDSTTPRYLCLVTKTAQKLGRNGGSITFKVLATPSRQQLFLRIVANEGGGFFSPDMVLFDDVEACLPDDRTQPLPAKIFASAFTGKSANNPSFMAAILRTEGLLGPVEGKPNLHLLTGDWSAWMVGMLALTGDRLHKNSYTLPSHCANAPLAFVNKPQNIGGHTRIIY